MRARTKVLIFLALLLFAGLIGIKVWRVCARATKPYSKLFRDITYVPQSKDPFQTLDLYIPKKAIRIPIPVIVWIHGGAWMSGDKNHPPAQIVLDRGYALASLNYRLSQQAVYPAQIYDCKAAIRYIRAHAAEYKLDPDRIGAWGHSAGGHLVALLGASCNAKDVEGDLGNNNVSSRVQAVADWAGPTDFLTIAKQAPPNCRIDFKSPTNPVAVLMGSSQSPVAYLSASPVQYVSKDDPPFYILHAQDDDVVPVDQAKELGDLLKKSGVPVVCHISPYGNHGLFKPEFAVETMDFFDRNLTGK